jgi:hypothetical protein
MHLIVHLARCPFLKTFLISYLIYITYYDYCPANMLCTYTNTLTTAKCTQPIVPHAVVSLTSLFFKSFSQCVHETRYTTKGVPGGCPVSLQQTPG